MDSKTWDYLQSIGATERALPETPKELVPFACYIPDSGYCIIVIPEKFHEVSLKKPEDYEVPVPYRYVIARGYTISNGEVYCDVEYDEIFGVVVPNGYEVYEASNRSEQITEIMVGKPYLPLVGLPEGARFSLGDDGAWIFVSFRNPTAAEINQFSTKKPLRVAVFYRMGILVLLFKFGNLEWIDAPYTPHIGNYKPMQYIAEGQGIRLTSVLVDSPSGVVKQQIRVVGLSTQFSRQLSKILLEMLATPFNEIKYNDMLNKTYNNLSTMEMVANSIADCTIS